MSLQETDAHSEKIDLSFSQDVQTSITLNLSNPSTKYLPSVARWIFLK